MAAQPLGHSATETRHMFLNMGPSHPAMHGIVQLIVELDGERVMGCDVEIGYLHRAFEKESERGPYNNVMPYTDRLNYVSPLINNFGFCLAVERLLGIEVTERCQYIRVIMSEISRITDHLTCIGASAMEIGAFTVFLYMIKAREWLWELVEAVTGARLTISYGRIGGVKADLPEGFAEWTRRVLEEVRKVVLECDTLLTRNRIFADRMQGTGIISKERAISYGITGPFLRGSGIVLDTRKSQPYFVYDRMSFDIPTGEHGDNYDRYLVRMEEMEQSMRIIEQALASIPAGPINIDSEGRVLPANVMVDEAKMGQVAGFKQVRVTLDPTLQGSTRGPHEAVYSSERRVALPAKEDTYGNIEGLMNHFKLIMLGHGLRPPAGEYYSAVEGANGEVGFYVVSDGGDRPYRVRVHPPCFAIMAALPELIVGDMLADIIPTFGSVNMIGGELDR
ncbi:MAG: NADH-quinone oxidoreductase subunit D [Candidatus Omnitrophica bacterium]|nr:NADH-quinone oxidoreductase subunit D [Candidatus Omnitrophota bacterium]